ncbi:hypothetical protein [Burkholderia sp. BCC1047]|uniref:hypothetical protein n=1 Tax=Burkholderia sp. BCC1047 TaxID=2676299 RepID=UPI00158D0026|nr:hypothetical protein [Burkholderia sp. BCC1047]
MNNYDRLDFTADPAVIDVVEKNSPHDGAAALQHFNATVEPTGYVVDVTNDQVVVSGKGVLATYYWRASPYDSRVARLSAQPHRQIVGDSSGETFRVVAGAVDDIHRPAAVLAEHLSEVELDELPMHEWIHAESSEGNMPDTITDEREGQFYLKVGGAI